MFFGLTQDTNICIFNEHSSMSHRGNFACLLEVSIPAVELMEFPQFFSYEIKSNKSYRNNLFAEHQNMQALFGNGMNCIIIFDTLSLFLIS